MEAICIEDVAFYSLIEKVVARIKEKHDVKIAKWISGEEAMHILRITSKPSKIKGRRQNCLFSTRKENHSLRCRFYP